MDFISEKVMIIINIIINKYSACSLDHAYFICMNPSFIVTYFILNNAQKSETMFCVLYTPSRKIKSNDDLQIKTAYLT